MPKYTRDGWDAVYYWHKAYAVMKTEELANAQGVTHGTLRNKFSELDSEYKKFFSTGEVPKKRGDKK